MKLDKLKKDLELNKQNYQLCFQDLVETNAKIVNISSSKNLHYQTQSKKVTPLFKRISRLY